MGGDRVPLFSTSPSSSSPLMGTPKIPTVALGLALWGKSVPALPGGDLTSRCGARGQGCVFWQSIRPVDEDQEQQVAMKLLVYGTRTSKDKSGAYLFLPDNEAKVPQTPHRTGRLPCVGGNLGGAWHTRVLRYCGGWRGPWS